MNSLIILESVMKNTYKYLALQSNSFRPNGLQELLCKSTVTHFSEYSRWPPRKCVRQGIILQFSLPFLPIKPGIYAIMHDIRLLKLAFPTFYRNISTYQLSTFKPQTFQPINLPTSQPQIIRNPAFKSASALKADG